MYPLYPMSLSMKKTISLVLILFFCIAAFAGPKYDATYHLISKSYTLNVDGSMDFHFRKELQLFSKAAFDTYGETFIWYNPEYQTLIINESYTIRKDGSKVETPKNAFNPSLPYACENCERFNAIREMVVTHTALEYDATIVLDYTIHTEQPFMQELMERVNLYEDEPVERYEISVSVPVNRHIFALENAWGGQRAERVFQMEHKWVFTNMMPNPDESYLPADFLPYVQFTTLDGPSTFLMRMSMQNAFYSNDKPFSSMADEIAAQSSDKIEQMLALRDYVSQNINSNGVPMRYMNYLVASPAMVWNSNCGNGFEKNLLLQAMLREAGSKAVIGIFYSSLLTDPESAVRVVIDGKSYYVSAEDDGNVSLDNVKRHDKFVAFTDEVVDMDNQPVKIEVSAELKIEKDGDKYKVQKAMRTSEVKSPKANTFTPSEPKLALAHVSKLSGSYVQMQITDGVYGCGLRASAISQRRTNPVAVTPTDESYIYAVVLPANSKWITKDRLIEKFSDFGYMRIENKVIDGKMQIIRQLKINRPLIQGKKQLQQLREMLAEWNVERTFIFSHQ